MDLIDRMNDKSNQRKLFDERGYNLTHCFRGDDDEIQEQISTNFFNNFSYHEKDKIKSTEDVISMLIKNKKNSADIDDSMLIQTNASHDKFNDDSIHMNNLQNQSYIKNQNDVNSNLNTSEHFTRHFVYNKQMEEQCQNKIQFHYNVEQRKYKQNGNTSNEEKSIEVKLEIDQGSQVDQTSDYYAGDSQPKKLNLLGEKGSNIYIDKAYQHNYEKAAHIINNVINKSMNRVQRVNKHVNNFISSLNYRKKDRKIPNMQQKEYELINDITHYFINSNNSKLLSKILIKLYHLTKFRNPIPVFMLTDTLRVCWDIFQVVFTFVFIYFYSILMFFSQEERDSHMLKQSFKFTFFIFTFDVLLNFNSAYFDKDTVVVNRKKIAKKYIFSHVFLTDCISLIIMGSKVIFESTNLVYNPNNSLTTFGINFLIFLKLNGVSKKRSGFDYVFTLKENQKHIVRLCNQLLSVISIAHISCLGWYSLGLYETKNGYPISWLSKANIESETYYKKYIYSMYWSITTMTTVGYGDISATNYVEAIFISVNMILFSCVFAYSINNIGIILQEIEKSSKLLNDNISTMQRYLNRKKVNISLQSRVRHYLSFLAEEQKDRDQQSENQILGLLSNKLRDEVTIEINTRILKNYGTFSANFSSQTLRKLVFIMEEVLISPNEIIFEEGDNDDNSIYFIESGIIEIYQHITKNQSNSSNIKSQIHLIQQLNSHQLFGEISFFSGLARKACARSVNLSTLYKIDRNEFIELLKENLEDFERFKMLEEQIKIQCDINSIHVECYNCKSLGHIANNCPRIHQVFDYQFKALKHNFSLFQNRSSEIQRKNHKKNINPKFLVKKNKELTAEIKENCRDFNSQTQIMFNSEVDFQTQSTDQNKNSKNLDTEYSTTSSSSSQQSESSIQSGKSSNYFGEKSLSKSSTKRQKKDKIQSSKKVKSSKNVKLSLMKVISNQKEDSNKNLNSIKEFEVLESLVNNEKQNLGLQKGSYQKKCSVEDTYYANKSISLIEKESELSKQEIIHKADEESESIIEKLASVTDKQLSNNKIYQIKQPSSILSDTSELDLSCKSPKEIQEDNHKKSNRNRDSNSRKYTLQINKDIQEMTEYDEVSSILSEDNIKKSKCQPEKKLKNYKKKVKRSKLSQSSIKDMVDDKFSLENQIHTAYQTIFFALSQGQNNPQQEVNNNTCNIQPNMNIEDHLSGLAQNRSKSIKNIPDQNSNKRNTQLSQSSIFKKLSIAQDTKSFTLPLTNQSNHSNSILIEKQNSQINNRTSNVIGLPTSNNIGNNISNNLTNSQLITEKLQKIFGTNYFNVMGQQQGNLSQNENVNQQKETQFFIFIDVMKSYKKFFPENNFENVMNQLKSKYNNKKQKKTNKQSIVKNRRQNILLQQDTTRKSMFCNIINNKSTPSIIHQDHFKPPTYLSYGTCLKNDSIFPKNALKKEFMSLKQNE